MFARHRLAAVVQELGAAGERGAVTILLTHTPDNALALRPDSGVDVTIAGHTHGGQVQVPGFGPLFIASRVPRRVGAGGLHELNGNLIYVSRGVGWEKGHAPRMRFWCPPEVAMVEME